jgi:mRNA-degrading endonuclease RelE of RelBE toxin-antitoxin system
MKQIDGLANDPFPRQTAKLEGGEELYRIRVADYRVI